MNRILAVGLLATTILYLTPSAKATGVLDNGTLMLGVDNFAQLGVDGGIASPILGTTMVGLRYNETSNEAISHQGGFNGWVIGDLTAVDQTNGQDTVATTYEVTDTKIESLNVAGDLHVTHTFAASATPNLYAVDITIKNNGNTDVADLRYTRMFDWNVEPGLEGAAIKLGGSAPKSQQTVNGNRVTFDFTFGELKSGDATSFQIFYGAAENQALALSALGAVLAEVYSLGQATCDTEVGGTGCATASNAFIFGARGLGGQSIGAEDVPLPGAALLFITGLGGATLLRRRRKSLN